MRIAFALAIAVLCAAPARAETIDVDINVNIRPGPLPFSGGMSTPATEAWYACVMGATARLGSRMKAEAECGEVPLVGSAAWKDWDACRTKAHQRLGSWVKAEAACGSDPTKIWVKPGTPKTVDHATCAKNLTAGLRAEGIIPPNSQREKEIVAFNCGQDQAELDVRRARAADGPNPLSVTVEEAPGFGPVTPTRQK